MFTRERIIVIMLVAVILLTASFYSFWQKQAASERISVQSEEQRKSGDAVNPTKADTAKTVEDCVVYISGAVNRPGVFHVPVNSRVVDVVQVAGGLTAAADQIKINLAEKIRDGMHIHVPDKNSTVVAGSGGTVISSSDGQEKVNINSAGKEELDKLPGIGPAMAERIVEYRETAGMFKDVADLKNVPGIGEAKFKRLADKITI
ncbi:helix-hairpin-helix domain-containing protein [Propionispora hippei]|uniref:Competence protein ComEA n=1 Tax=Propionispora hippei DSM 15287 TaxID=1123003 RepID=A0A1M6AK46_9FIRM|nr:helix-hairpin-helix domain-containing protein [Propionispora hippei]SHI36879.1 competence protein ComEA [Propionispora hippei DSM 15287]